jgi:hypothetical protein
VRNKIIILNFVINVTEDEDLEDLVINCNGVYGCKNISAGSKLSKVGAAVINMLMGFQVAIEPFHLLTHKLENEE